MSAHHVQVFRVSAADAVITLTVLTLMSLVVPLALFGGVVVPGLVFVGIVGWFWWNVLCKIPVRVEVGEDGSVLLVAKLRRRDIHVNDLTGLDFNSAAQITMRSSAGKTLIKVNEGDRLFDLLCQLRPDLADTLSPRSRRELAVRRAVATRGRHALPQWYVSCMVMSGSLCTIASVGGGVAKFHGHPQQAPWGGIFFAGWALLMGAILWRERQRRTSAR